MTKLPTQVERDAINLKTWEQAILYSANLLLAGENISATRFNRNFTILPDLAKQEVVINCLIKLDFETYYASNLNYYKGIQPFEGDGAERIVNYDGETLSPNLTKTIIDPPPEVSNLESFFIYSVINYKDYLISQSIDDTKVMYEINLRLTGIFTSISLNFKKLDFDITNDLLISLDLNYLIGSSQLSNSHQLSNNSRLIN